MVQPITHFLENTPGPYYKVVQITSLSPMSYIHSSKILVDFDYSPSGVRRRITVFIKKGAVG